MRTLRDDYFEAHHCSKKESARGQDVKPQSPGEVYHAPMSGRFANFFDDSIFVPDFTRERRSRLIFDFLMSPVSGFETREDLNTAKHFLKSELSLSTPNEKPACNAYQYSSRISAGT